MVEGFVAHLVVDWLQGFVWFLGCGCVCVCVCGCVFLFVFFVCLCGAGRGFSRVPWTATCKDWQWTMGCVILLAAPLLQLPTRLPTDFFVFFQPLDLLRCGSVNHGLSSTQSGRLVTISYE